MIKVHKKPPIQGSQKFRVIKNFSCSLLNQQKIYNIGQEYTTR